MNTHGGDYWQNWNRPIDPSWKKIPKDTDTTEVHVYGNVYCKGGQAYTDGSYEVKPSNRQNRMNRPGRTINTGGGSYRKHAENPGLLSRG